MAIPPLRRLFHLVVRPPRAREAIELEIRFHLESVVRDLVAQGWQDEAAEAEARRRFGDLERTREALVTIDTRGGKERKRREWRGDLWQDLGYVLRALRRSPGFAAGVVVTLGLGIGANATMVGLVDRLLFKPPAHVAAPDRVTRLQVTRAFQGWGTFPTTSLSYPEYQDQLTRARSLTALAAYSSGALSLGRGETARPLPVTMATASFFPVLGVRPALGRFYTEEEDRRGAGAPVVVISERLWRGEFGGARDVLGRSILLGSRPLTVIGVAPRGFTGVDLSAVDAWLPLNTGAADLVGKTAGWTMSYGWQWLRVVAKLKPGADRRGASAEATQIFRTVDQKEGSLDRGRSFVTYQPVIAARGAERSDNALVAALLAGVSFLVLLIACANVANLFLARGIARRREVAVRLALGIGRGRLVRLLLLESVTLAAGGTALALVLAQYGGGLLRAVLLPGLEFAEAPVDTRVVLFTACLGVVSGLLSGLAPALQLSRPDLTVELKGSGIGDGRSGGRHHARLRTGLLLTQATLSAVLLVGAGLFVQSLRRAAGVDLGFQPANLITAEIDLGVAGYTRDQTLPFYEQAYERLRTLPGVEAASLAAVSPFQYRFSTSVSIPGRDSLPRFATGGPYYDAVTPSHLATLGLRLTDGRWLTEADTHGAPFVLVVNQILARRYWPGERAVGKCLRVLADTMPCRDVVGVVADIVDQDIKEERPGFYYVPLEQSEGLTRTRVLHVRTRADLGAMLTLVRRTLQGMAPNLPFARVVPVWEQFGPQLQPWRLGATMFGIFGLLALLVASVGLFSVMSYVVAQRRREFGIRTALGATARDVLRLVLRQGLLVVLLGIGLGSAAALAAGKWLGSLLFHTSPRDPWVYLLAAATLTLAAVAACLWPARRATRVDPVHALRAE